MRKLLARQNLRRRNRRRNSGSANGDEGSEADDGRTIYGPCPGTGAFDSRQDAGGHPVGGAERNDEVLSYGIPTFRYKRGIVALAAFKDHCSFFPLGSSVLDQFKDELKPFRTSKGTLHFPLDKPMPAALVKKIVRARLAENRQPRQKAGSSPLLNTGSE